MHAALALQVAVGIVGTGAGDILYLHGDRLDTCVVSLQQIYDSHLIAALLSPAHIHTHKHLRPVLGLCASGAGVYLQHGIHRVFLLTQHIAQFKVLNGSQSTLISLIDFFLCQHLVAVELQRQLQLIGRRAHLLVAVKPLLQLAHNLHLGAGTLRVIPKVRSLRAQVLLFVFYLLTVYVQILVQRLCTVKYVF